MKRDIESQILAWKERVDRKPLVLMGARQVGKTWLMEDFGRRNFARVHKFNFDSQSELKGLFERDKDPEILLPKLSVLGGAKIDTKNDVLIFDEIQECGDALNSLKYFNEKCPELAIMSAGSLLGVKLQKNRKKTEDLPKTYPVGKVELLDVEPISFPEFLRARNEMLWEFYLSIKGDHPIDEIFHHRLWNEYLLYLMVGGMPEVVSSYLKEGDPRRVRKLQSDLVTLYENDIVKYNGNVDAAKILVILRSVVSQLAKENSKFIYGAAVPGARARGYEEAIEWLVSARMVRRINNLEAIEYPLERYDIRNAFKLYLNDVGMLKSMAGVADESILLDKDFSFKGHLVENYVFQQLAGRTDAKLHYWAERSDREIDCVVQYGDEVIPIEIKAGRDKRAAAFKSFVNVHHPKYAIRFSEMNLRRDGAFINIPIYLVPRFAACLD